MYVKFFACYIKNLDGQQIKVSKANSRGGGYGGRGSGYGASYQGGGG